MFAEKRNISAISTTVETEEVEDSKPAAKKTKGEISVSSPPVKTEEVEDSKPAAKKTKGEISVSSPPVKTEEIEESKPSAKKNMCASVGVSVPPAQVYDYTGFTPEEAKMITPADEATIHQLMTSEDEAKDETPLRETASFPRESEERFDINTSRGIGPPSSRHADEAAAGGIIRGPARDGTPVAVWGRHRTALRPRHSDARIFRQFAGRTWVSRGGGPFRRTTQASAFDEYPDRPVATRTRSGMARVFWTPSRGPCGS
jgi:hypothetical protein